MGLATGFIYLVVDLSGARRWIVRVTVKGQTNAFDQLGTDQPCLDDALWLDTHPGGLTEQQVIDTFGTLNGTGTILTLDFGGSDVLEVQNGAGIDQAILGANVFIF